MAKLALALLLALAVAGATAKRDLLQACVVNVQSISTSDSQNAVAAAFTSAFASCQDAKNRGLSCPGACSTYAQAAATAVSRAFAQAASKVFASISGGPNCFAQGSAKSSAQSFATAIAESFSSSISQKCNGANVAQYKNTIVKGLATAFTNAGVTVGCQGGGSAEAAANIVAKDTLDAIACSISAAFSQCICNVFARGGVYTSNCFTGLAEKQELTADAYTKTTGQNCKAAATGTGGAGGPLPAPSQPTVPSGFFQGQSGP